MVKNIYGECKDAVRSRISQMRPSILMPIVTSMLVWICIISVIYVGAWVTGYIV